ncbi:translation initiation factor eIF-2B subunit epsilon isoform X3 [Vespula pensylvanica]|uniref:translation initiation factor eIF-2B subunit epsilon isoform X3 n=1 Tax=Vespula pensylvanica TaxID=30213 RepID=UPI001CBA43DC|nr:translation initiation factor eIF-2B subunit epsilon isoform X3 [Vespula pensylvanica]
MAACTCDLQEIYNREQNIMDTKLRKKDVLQAVVLADDFTTALTPMQDVCPSILLPVLNIPLLDYLIETLKRSRIQELFLYCSNHVDSLKKYVKLEEHEDLVINLIISDGCRSLGDALRDIDTKCLIRDYFILIRGNTFIKTDLLSALNFHCTKEKRDKGAAMTMLLRNVGCTNDSFIKEETSLVVSNKANNKILFYKKLRNNDKKIKLELNWFLDNSEIDISTCFIDTHVYLCSPAVLPLFADNFDFQTIEDFIKGVLMNEEILNARIYWQLLNPDDYSLPITSWNAYYTLSRDILHRRGYPYAPGMFGSLRNFVSMSQSNYKHKSVTLAKGCILEKDCLIGKNSTLGQNTFITKSVIGNNCTIGQVAIIKNSFIFSNVKIGNFCKIIDSIIFSDCNIKKNAKLDGCILVCNTIVNLQKQYVDSILEMKNANLITKRMSDLDVNERLLYFKDNEATEYNNYTTDESTTNESSRQHTPIPDDTNLFLTEVIDSLLRGFQDKLNCENLILEINSSRYAYNVTMREVTYNVIKAILSLPLHYLSEIKVPVNNQNYQKNLKIMINYFQPIILNYIKTDVAQEDCLHAVEEVGSVTQELLPFLQHLLHLFYDRDILTEDKILEWYESNDEKDEIQDKKVKIAVQPFIKWLQEAEEDSSESD